MNKIRREKGQNQTHPKKLQQIDGDKEMNTVIQDQKEKFDEI